MNCALVVGSGSIAKKHIANIRALYPSIEVICVSSRGREIKPGEVGATEVADSIQSAILMRPDFAIVASPANLHIHHSISLVEAKIPVLIEKPISTGLAEIYNFKLKNKDCKVAVGYNLRFLPSATVVKELIASEKLGLITTIFSEVGQYLPDWRPGTDYRESVSARHELGGGPLLELSHELDYLIWMFGAVSKVNATINQSGLLAIDTEDTVDALLSIKKGGVVHLHMDFLQRQPCRNLKVIGEHGTLLWDLLKDTVFLLGPDGKKSNIHCSPKYDSNGTYIEQLRAFIDYSFGGGKFGSTVETASEVIQLVDAIRHSSETGKWVYLGEQ